jgi:membrane protein implicated in regulation of membrane protease activity
VEGAVGERVAVEDEQGPGDLRTLRQPPPAAVADPARYDSAGVATVPDWLYWVIAAGVLALGEMFTLDLSLAMIATGALLGALLAAVGAPVVAQVAVAAAVAVALLAVVRPIARRHLHTPQRLRTGTAALIGAKALVLERVDDNGGRVKIAGEVWTARSFEEGRVIEPGSTVQVAKIDGATALVYE